MRFLHENQTKNARAASARQGADSIIGTDFPLPVSEKLRIVQYIFTCTLKNIAELPNWSLSRY